MSKILKAGETGYGVLIESDAGYADPSLNPQFINEALELKIGEPVLINCILQKWGVKNKNGRIYPKDVLIPQVNEYQKMVDTNSAVSECFTPDTKIMTKTGWKLIKNLSENEEILTLNRETRKTEYQQITKKIYDDYTGDLYHIKSNAMDIKVTPNHRFLVEDAKGNLIEKTAYELFENTDHLFFNGKHKFLKKFDYDYSDDLEFIFDDINISPEDFYAFMGIYLAEGCVITDRNLIQITQKKDIIIEKIENLLVKTKLNYYKTTRKTGTIDFKIKNTDLYIYLSKLGKSHQKHIPVELKNNSPYLLKILLEWFLIGDGRNVTYKEKNGSINNRKSVFSVSKKLIYDLNEIQLKSGGSGNISIDAKRKDRIIFDNKYIIVDGEEKIIKTERIIKRINSRALFTLNFSKSEHIYLDKRTIKINKIHYDGKIVCVKVPNETIYVMRNGKSLWTLNSDHPDSSIVSLQNVSHMVTKMWWGKNDQENVLFGQIKLIVSPGFLKYGVASMIGDKIAQYLKDKIRLGISSRGIGSLKEVNGENLVQNDYELIGFDLVTTPSTPGAFLFPENSGDVKFGENYVKKNGVYINENQKIISALNKFLL